MNVPLPNNENQRLAALHACHILDTFPESGYDDIVNLIAQICSVPIAAITLVDANRQWFKSMFGLEDRETSREISLCTYTILESDLLIVSDVSQDSRFQNHPAVTSTPGIGFYAGAPLITHEGYALGALCIADYAPREITPQQKSALRLMARQVVSQIESGRLMADHDRLLCTSRQAEWELSRLGAIVASAEEAILATTLDGTIVAWNKAAERLYGYMADEMMGRHAAALVEPEQKSPVPAVIARLQHGEAVVRMEVMRRRKDRTRFQAALSFSPIHSPAGDMVGLSCIARDITAQKSAEKALSDSQAALAQSKKQLVEAQRVARIGSWEYDLIRHKLTWSDELFRLFEMDPTNGEPTVKRLMHCHHPEDAARHQAILTQAIRDGLPYSVDTRILRQNGAIRWVHAVGHCEQDSAGCAVRMFGTLMDIHERKLAEERFRALFEHSSDAQLFFDAQGMIDCNPAAVALLGCSDKAELLALPPTALSPALQPDRRRSDEKSAEMEALAYAHGAHRFEWTYCRRNGDEFPVEVTLTSVTLADRPVLLGQWHDLTERKQTEEKIKDHAVVLEFQKGQIEASAELEALATTDGLTGLKNRRAFQERLTVELHRAVRYGTSLSLVLLDVDRFKSYNDTFGHPAGDAVLQGVGSILQESVRDSDLAARYGGEEFVLLLPHTDLAGAAAFAERLRGYIEDHPWPMQAVTASFGVAQLCVADEDSIGLISRADQALYQSKASGRNRVTSASLPFLFAELTDNSVHLIKQN